MAPHKGLYLDQQHKKLTGVCAGVANYFEIEPWVVRIFTISAVLLGGSFLIILIYVALSLMLDKQPIEAAEAASYTKKHAVKQKPWQQGQSSKVVLENIQKTLQDVETRVCQIEALVTSETFQVHRAFRDL